MFMITNLRFSVIFLFLKNQHVKLIEVLRLIEYTNSIYCVILILGYFKPCTNFCPFKACFTLAWECVCVGGVSFTHKPIYASKRAHLDGPITPVVMDSSTELGSFLMMTSDWGLSQSSEIFFIAVVGYVLYWLKSIPNPSDFSGQNFWIRWQEVFWIKWPLQSKDDKKEIHKDECSSYDL